MSDRRHPRQAGWRWRGCLASVVALVALAAAAPSAQGAKFVHEVFAGIPDPVGGLADGELRVPMDVAVNRPAVADGAVGPLGDPVDGYVYVVEQGNDRVQVFDADGEFAFMFGGGVEDGSAAGQVCDRSEVPCTGRVDGGLGGMFDSPQGIAIDQASGRVFVRERGNRRVQEFTAGGAFVRAWGWDVVAEGTGGDTAADEFETCLAAADCQAGSAGSGLGQFGSSSGFGIDVHAPSGDVFVVDPSNRRVQRFDVPANPSDPLPAPAAFGSSATFGSGEPGHLAVDDGGVVYASDGGQVDRYDLDAASFLAPLEVDAYTGPLAAGPEVRGVEIDPATGNLFVSVAGRTGFGSDDVLVSPVLELDGPAAAAAGDVGLADTHVAGTGIGWQGFGLDPDGDELYLSHATGPGAEGHRVLAAGDGPAGPASVAFLPHSDVGSDGATVNVEISSQWPLPTDYEVQVARSSDPADFEVVAAGTVPEGDATTVESVELSGLRPKTLYLVRVVTRKPYGNPRRSFDGPVLLTKAKAPDLAAVGADSLTPTSARLAGRVNPNGTATSYRFEWGPADGGLHHAIPIPDAPVGAGFDYEFVSQQLTGLQPDTAYRFRLVATSDDTDLGATTSPIHTFTTPAADPPAGRAYELVSPPDKIAGVGAGEWYAGPGSAYESGLGAEVGERFAVQGVVGSMLLDGAHGYSNDWAFADRVDGQSGWVSHSPITHPACAPEGPRSLNVRATTPTMSLSAWSSNSGLLHILPGMCEWSDQEVNNPSWIGDWEGRWEIFGPTALDQILDEDDSQTETAVAADGSVVVGTTGSGVGATGGLRGMAGPGDPTHPDWPDLVAGRTVYAVDVSGGLSDSFPGAAVRRLVHVCAGGTELPAVDGSGDMTAAGCAAPGAGRDARLVSDRGATTVLAGSAPLEGTVSDDGSRVFFLAPDPSAAGVPDGRSSFCLASGDVCPSQLFVRQRNPDGSIATRWISRAEDGLLGSQDAGLTGAVRFEGATPDGDKAFFRTSSPLTVDDPNGEGAPTAGGVKSGQASDSSWDLYVYDLPDAPGADPGDGELTRITAGPTGDGDCNRPQNASAGSAMLRLASEDGSRVYFVCAAPLEGAVVPGDGERLTVPGGEVSTADRANLYLYDADRPIEERWRFVARLPADIDGSGLDGCATAGTQPTTPLSVQSLGQGGVQLKGSDVNCVRGTSDGSFVSFWTRGRLTADDPDSSSADIYAYDAATGRLTRVSAPQGGVGGTYECVTQSVGAGLRCFGDMGFDQGGSGVATDPLDAGSRVVFFQSRSRLVPGDRDGAYDVYEWRDGRLSLVSTGRSTTDGAFLKGNDVTGRNVYFASRDVLSWQDVDRVLDIYTARVGGGIAEPEPAPVCDALGGGCQAGGGHEAVRPRGDSRQRGSGNASPAPPAVARRLVVGRPGGRVLRRAARSGVVRLGVRLAGGRGGVVRGVARARVRTRAGRVRVRPVGVGRVRVRRSGRAVLAVRLGRRARVRLRRRGGMVVAVRVVARGVEPAGVRLVLRRRGR